MHIKASCRNLLQSLSGKKVSVTAAVLMTLASGFAAADDTEVFFGRESAQANVLLIIDVSGSMGSWDGTGMSRINRLKLALNELLTTTNDINVGLLTYNGTGTSFLHAVKPITQHRDELLASIDALTVNQTTPTVAALHEGKMYFSGEQLTTAKRRSFTAPYTYTCTDPNSITDACWENSTFANLSTEKRLPHPDTYTLDPNARIDRHEHCTDANLSHPSCSNEAIDGNATFNSPMISECQSNHIVLLTDGIPSSNSARAEIVRQELGLAACQDITEPGFPTGGTCGADLAAYMANNDLNDSVNDTNTVITHTIGFELDENWPWLTSLSTAGLGTHHNAGSAESLVSAFEAIVEVAQKELNTFVAPAITVDRFSGLSHRDDVYLALFKPSARSNWEGNLKRYKYSGNPPVLRDFNGQPAVDPATGKFYVDSQSWWSETADGNNVGNGGAIGKLDASLRNVYTHITGNVLTDIGNVVHENNTAITSSMLGVADTERTDLLQWTRGVDVLDYDEDPTTTTRRQMGDPLHSQPLVVTYGKVNDEPDSVAYFGTNQGYLHAVNTQDGVEVFSFVPKELLPNLQTFYNDERRINKLYGLDGDITSWIKDNNNDGVINTNDHAYLYVGMRRGGNNYYALDVTEKENPKHLWTIKGGPGGDADFADLGQTWSKPTLRNLMINGTKTKVLIFGGGYDSMQDNSNIRSADTIGNAIFIVNAETGDLIWKTTATDYPEMVYSIPSDPNVIDINGDGIADQLYVGDMGGQVWRLDFNKNSTSSSDLVSGDVIADLATNAPANLRKFFYRPDIALNKGEGNRKSYLSISLGSGNRAHPLDETVDDKFYMIKQFDVFKAPEDYGIKDESTGTPFYRPITQADLYDATDNDVDSNNPVAAAAAAAQLNSAQGWSIELGGSGEKVLSHSLTVNGGVNFTTYLPEAGPDLCSPSIGSSKMYRVEVNDASPTKGTSRESDIPGSGIASSPHLFFTEEDAYIGEGTRTVEGSNLKKLRKTYWSEQSD